MLGVYLIPFEGQSVVCIYIDNEKIDTYTFDEEYQEIEIETSYGYNKLIISEGMAFISESNCHTGSCVSNKPISRPGSMIICAPHHLVIKIETIPDEGES
jgi:hypothetical protein